MMINVWILVFWFKYQPSSLTVVDNIYSEKACISLYNTLQNDLSTVGKCYMVEKVKGEK